MYIGVYAYECHACVYMSVHNIGVSVHEYTWVYITLVYMDVHEYTWVYITLVYMDVHEYTWVYITLVYMDVHGCTLVYVGVHWFTLPWVYTLVYMTLIMTCKDTCNKYVHATCFKHPDINVDQFKWHQPCPAFYAELFSNILMST